MKKTQTVLSQEGDFSFLLMALLGSRRAVVTVWCKACAFYACSVKLSTQRSVACWT